MSVGMAAFSSMEAEDVIGESRRESSVGNFPDALHILTAADEASSSLPAIRAEMGRICIILGDHQRALLASTVNPGITQRGNGMYNDLLFIQCQLSRISTDGELGQSLRLATSLFQKWKQILESESSDDIGVSRKHHNLEKESTDLEAPHTILLP